MSRSNATAVFVLPLALGLALDAWAGPQGQAGGQAPQPAQAAPRNTGPAYGRGREGLSESVRRVERDTHGRVLSAEPVPYDGRNVNRIKVVDSSGRVRVIMDDPDQPAPHARDDDN